jgi:methyltransferase (TIGR00027 family)
MTHGDRCTFAAHAQFSLKILGGGAHARPRYARHAMKPGQASRTAVIVATGRAIAHGAAWAANFSDPTAYALLPDDARARVEAIRAGVVPKGVRSRIAQAFRERQAKVTAARTIAIDQAVREAATPQLVILGAGLDGRAWRMPELRDVTVFEVDHPDSQRDKRARTAALAPVARDVRFVPVDFSRDDLERALSAAGHDATRPTTWIWEGVVMYLTPAEVEATLAIIARRSATGSRLIVLYHGPFFMRVVIGLVTRSMGEPLRSKFTPAEMRELLAKHGFSATRDDDLALIGAAISTQLGEATRMAKMLRLVVAERR